MSLDTQLQNAFTAVGNAVKGKISTTQKGTPNGVASLDGSGKVPVAQLPSYVDDVLEFANLSVFPESGETGKIYVAIDTNRVYRWSGTAYILITSGAVDSVNGLTGVVTITDITGNSGTSTKLATPRNIAGVSFDGTIDINIPFSNLTSKPTTVAGYNISDAMTTEHVANSITGFGTNTVVDGIASPGSSTLVSRADHVHATDSTRQSTINATGILKGSGDGSITAGIAGTDYVIPSGNVASATKLETPRTINGVSFDGTENINIEVENKIGAPIISAGTITIGTTGLGNYIHITGSNNISSFDTASTVGIRRTLVFDNSLVIAHSASLICPGAENINVLPGTIIETVSETTENWRVVSITHPSISMAELSYLDGVSSNIQTQLADKSNLESPIFTGTPSLPTGTIAVTQSAGDNSTKLATTSYVTGAISTVTTSIGATDTNYVDVFNAALL